MAPPNLLGSLGEVGGLAKSAGTEPLFVEIYELTTVKTENFY